MNIGFFNLETFELKFLILLQFVETCMLFARGFLFAQAHFGNFLRGLEDTSQTAQIFNLHRRVKYDLYIQTVIKLTMSHKYSGRNQWIL